MNKKIEKVFLDSFQCVECEKYSSELDTDDFNLFELGRKYFSYFEIMIAPTIESLDPNEFKKIVVEKEQIEVFCKIAYDCDIQKLALDEIRTREVVFKL